MILLTHDELLDIIIAVEPPRSHKESGEHRFYEDGKEPFDEEDGYTTDNGPTGHGEDCFSDADPGM